MNLNKIFSKMESKELMIFEAARLCYELDISQQEVAKTLGVSPATLTRLLQKAKDLGIIKITVQPPYEYFKGLDELSQEVRKTLGITEVIIVPASSKINVTRKELGFAACRWISSILIKGMKIGFSGGRSVAEIMPFLKRSLEDVQVVQLMGGVSPTEKTIQADVIARTAADRLGGICHVIHGPAIFPDESSLAHILKNKIVSDVIEQFDSLDVSIVGIGTLTTDNPLLQCGFLSDEEVKHLDRLGCVGDICGHFFNQDGKECDPGLARRILGIRLEQLARTPRACAVAAGIDKVPAIIAACRAQIPKTIVTDIFTAQEIVK
jgi:DNA-binding transcriptional regulator LsrR (DeoR family)